MWLVCVEFEPEAVTDDFDKGEEHIRNAFIEAYNLTPEQAEEFLGLDLKLHEWCITYKRVRQRDYSLRRIETL